MPNVSSTFQCEGFWRNGLRNGLGRILAFGREGNSITIVKLSTDELLV